MEYADTIFNRTTIQLGWADRIKALLRGTVISEVEIDCEVAPGLVQSRSKAYTPVLFQRKSTGGGYAEISSPESNRS